MPSRALLRSFVALWFLAGGTLFILSLTAFTQALAPGGQPNSHLAVLAGVEALAALLFLIPRTMRIGAIGLLTTLAIAFVAHSLAGEILPQLVVYAAVVGFVMAHGVLSPQQWRHAIARRAV